MVHCSNCICNFLTIIKCDIIPDWKQLSGLQVETQRELAVGYALTNVIAFNTNVIIIIYIVLILIVISQRSATL